MDRLSLTEPNLTEDMASGLRARGSDPARLPGRGAFGDTPTELLNRITASVTSKVALASGEARREADPVAAAVRDTASAASKTAVRETASAAAVLETASAAAGRELASGGAAVRETANGAAVRETSNGVAVREAANAASGTAVREAASGAAVRETGWGTSQALWAASFEPIGAIRVDGGVTNIDDGVVNICDGNGHHGREGGEKSDDGGELHFDSGGNRVWLARRERIQVCDSAGFSSTC